MASRLRVPTEPSGLRKPWNVKPSSGSSVGARRVGDRQIVEAARVGHAQQLLVHPAAGRDGRSAKPIARVVAPHRRAFGDVGQRRHGPAARAPFSTRPPGGVVPASSRRRWRRSRRCRDRSCGWQRLHSGFTLPSLTTFCHLAISLRPNAANCSGVFAALIQAPGHPFSSSPRRWQNLLDLRVHALHHRRRRAGRRVQRRQLATSKPAMPASCSVGTSGSTCCASRR